eukprot:jgi/Mesvir1/18386/Mv14269-RA.1
MSISNVVRAAVHDGKKAVSLFEILKFLPDHGVGARIFRKSWRGGGTDKYFTLTKVAPSMDGRHGKIWGSQTWNGRPLRDGKVYVIHGANKMGVWEAQPTPEWVAGEAELHRILERAQHIKDGRAAAAPKVEPSGEAAPSP